MKREKAKKATFFAVVPLPQFHHQAKSGTQRRKITKREERDEVFMMC
jgi:hypothetical protein